MKKNDKWRLSNKGDVFVMSIVVCMIRLCVHKDERLGVCVRAQDFFSLASSKIWSHVAHRLPSFRNDGGISLTISALDVKINLGDAKTTQTEN